MIENLLKSNNLKITKQRVSVIKAIKKLGINATINNIVSLVNMDKSTVYRIIDKLLNRNIIEKDITFNNIDYYKLKSNHKHYMKCIRCDKIEELSNCPIENINDHDFKIISHNLKIEGICKKCQKA